MRYCRAILCVCFVSFSLLVSGQTINEPKNNPAEWSADYPAFRIAGNLYYVGTYDLASYLITSDKGHVLINTGLAASGKMIMDHVRALGFDPADIKVLLTTQAHFDHMGATAELAEKTGAKVMLLEADAQVAADGGASDYAFGGNGMMFRPVKADRLLHDGDTVRAGSTALVVLHHPGHTKGSASYLLDVKDEKRSYRVLIANFPTIVTDKKFTAIPAYPAIGKDYAYTLDTMKKLVFDLWVASHASQFGLHVKRKPGDGYRPGIFADRSGYDKQLSSLEQAYQRHTQK